MAEDAGTTLAAAAPSLSDEVFPLTILLACIDRELAMRKRVYPRWVEKHKMSFQGMHVELARMRAARAALIRGEAVTKIALQMVAMGVPMEHNAFLRAVLDEERRLTELAKPKAQ